MSKEAVTFSINSIVDCDCDIYLQLAGTGKLKIRTDLGGGTRETFSVDASRTKVHNVLVVVSEYPGIEGLEIKIIGCCFAKCKKKTHD